MGLIRAVGEMPIALASGYMYEDEYSGLSGIGDKHRMQEKWAKSFLKSGGLDAAGGVLEGAVLWLKKFDAAKSAGLGSDSATTAAGVSVAKSIFGSIPGVGVGLNVFSLFKGISDRKKAKTNKKNAKRVNQRVDALLNGVTSGVKSLSAEMVGMKISALPKASGAFMSDLKNTARKFSAKREGMPYWNSIEGVKNYARELSRRLVAARTYVESTISQTRQPSPTSGAVRRPDTVAPTQGHVWDTQRKAWVKLPGSAVPSIVRSEAMPPEAAPAKGGGLLVPAGIALLALKVLGG